jgi:PAS domain S-box-containing protein
VGGVFSERGTFLLALAAVIAVAALDAAVGGRAVLVELLLAGPLIAATRASPAQTGIVAILALALAIPLALTSDTFGSTEHVTGAVAVAVGGALCVVISYQRARREENSARLAVQYGVARVLAESETFEQAAPRLLEAIGRPLGWEIGHLWRAGDDGLLRSVADWRAEGVEAAEFERATHELAMPPGSGLPGQVWQSGHPAWLPDVIAVENFRRSREAASSGIRGGMAFPIRSANESLAVIELFSRRPWDPDPELSALTEALGAQIGEFIERRRATEIMRESELRAGEARDQLEAMLRGVADAVTAQAPDGRLLFANDAAVRTLGFESSDALLATDPREILAAFEILHESGAPFPIEDLPGRRALAGEDGAEAVVRFRVKETGEERWSNIKSTPIKDGGGRVTMAINVIEDITAHKRSERAQGFLARTSAVLGGWLDIDEVLTRVAELASLEMADWCSVDLVGDTGELDRVALSHADPELRARALELRRRYPPRQGGTGGGAYTVLRTGESELYPEITEEMLRAATRDEEHYELLRELGMGSAMMVPIGARGGTLGVLSFVTANSGRRYDGKDLEVAEELARRCATAIDNARLYRERSYIARTLQQSLLPVELPDIPGIEAAARFRPTGEGNDVGGDFYDMFESGERGWTVVMGDVCGKGPDAAAVTALARYTLRAAAMRNRLPSRSLHVLNEALLRQRTDRRFCTVAYAYLETVGDSARVGLASGGHPLPLLLRPDGSVELVGEPGTLLGVVPDPAFEDRAVSLAPGDALVFYTDGVIESRSAEGALGEAGLAELVASCAGRDADAIASHVEKAAMRSQRARPRDDIAVLVLRVAP